MAEFLPVVDLGALDGTDGFRLDGIDAGDYSGISVASAGDVNGDGFADVIVGAYFADPGGDSAAGESYVVFGKADWSTTATVDLAALDGTDGFRLDGIEAYDYSGRSVASAGDVNGDGFADILIGAYGADPGTDSYAGESYVVFGKADWSTTAVLDLAALDGTDGFRLDGIDAVDRSGYSVSSAGDVNGDGFADILIGAYGADPGTDSAAGESYVVFGKADWSTTAALDLSALDGTDGFRLDGIDADDRSGYSVSSAGDVNGDGFDDILIGAFGGDPGTDSAAGESYVVFGKADWSTTAALDLAALDGTGGFRLDGIDADDRSGYSVSSAGDVNGDGFADILIGAFRGDPGTDSGAGESYVVFGKADWSTTAAFDLSTLDGTDGFRLDGIDAGDQSGRSVSSAGDVNGDGFADILIGALGGDPGTDSYAGESYVVFGKADWSTTAALDLAALDGTDGFRLDGIDANDFSGRSVSSAGDVNGDGFADILIGASGGDPGTDSGAGESYVVFGHEALEAVTRIGTAIANRINGGVGNDTIQGREGDDTLFGRGGNDFINGGTGDDAMTGGAGDDRYIVREAGDQVIEEAGEGTGTDLVTALVSHTLADEVENLTLGGALAIDGTGNGLANRITGNGAANVLMGLAGDDLLRGGAGADTLIGGAGRDTMQGGADADAFTFAALADLGNTAAARDIVQDFVSGVDDLVFTGLGMTAFIGAGAFTGVAGQIRFGQGAANTIVYGDTDGDKAADFQVRLIGSIALAAGDIVL